MTLQKQGQEVYEWCLIVRKLLSERDKELLYLLYDRYLGRNDTIVSLEELKELEPLIATGLVTIVYKGFLRDIVRITSFGILTVLVSKEVEQLQ